MVPFFVACLEGGNDADGRAFNLNMNHKQQPALCVETHHSIACLIFSAGIHQTEEGIKKYRGCLLKVAAVFYLALAASAAWCQMPINWVE